MADTFTASFYAALSQSGIGYSGPVLADDKINRFRADGDHDANSWYALRTRGEITVGAYGCWKRNIKQSWCSKQNLTSDERKTMHEAMRDFSERDRKEREEKQAKARQIVTDGLKTWPKVTSHAYLEGKKVQPKGEIRVCQNELYPGWLVVPMIDAKGQVQSAQYIAPDGKKRFQFGGMVQGCYFPVNEDKSGPMVICEGLVTGISLADATGWMTICAFNCGNLLAVAKIARKFYPDRLIIIAGDNDAATEGNPGLTKATEAARAINGIVSVPDFGKFAGGKLTDYNDLACIKGRADVRQQILSAIPENQKPASIVLVERLFDSTSEPPLETPVYRLQNTTVATRGNIVTITAQVKTGKSAMIGAMQAATMCAPDSDSDCLGFTSYNPDGRLVLHFDSEQSRNDHWKATMRTLHRAHTKTPPPWFRSYLLTGLGYKRAWECVLEAVKAGPIHSIFLDGIADFVPDVNDAEICNAKVAELQQLAGNLDCPIICVIHFNPGSEKSRGHLGSELERKAESNLRLDKDEDTTVIWSNKQRGAPISKATGPAFQWSDDKQMHVSVASSADTKKDEKRGASEMLMAEVFGSRASLNYSEIVAGVVKTGCSESWAEKKAAKAKALGVIKREALGRYSLVIAP